MTQKIECTIIIDAAVSSVWSALTEPVLMKQWMADPEMQLEIITDWKVGAPIIIKGFHHLRFENKGTVLQFDSGLILRYNYLSNISRLSDIPENYTAVEFRLMPVENQSSLTVSIDGFPTETIFKHLDFYWRGAVVLIKRLVESGKVL
jgi:hypothetical protein